MTGDSSYSEKEEGRPGLPLGWVALAYLAFALVATYPLVLHPLDHACGISKAGVLPAATPPLSIWSMAVVLHGLPWRPLSLFEGNAFYPYPHTLAYSEHLFVPALMGAPLALLTGNLVLAYNGVVILTLTLAGLGMYLLGREISGVPEAAFGAGLLYAFHTWNMNELVRLQILSNEFFPFVLYGIVRFFARPSWKRGVLAGLAYALQSLSCMYWALYLPFVTAATVLALEWRRRLPLGALLRLALPLAGGLLVTGVFALPYVATARGLGFERPLPESLLVDRYLEVLPGNLLYGRGLHWLGTALPNQNAAHFLGFLAVLLGLLGAAGAFQGRDDRRGLVPLFAGLVFAGFVLSLGPEIQLGRLHLGPGPYLLLRRFAPGFRNVRYPERLSLLVALGLAPLVALGLARLKPRLGRGGVLALGLLVFLEHLSLPQPLSFLPTGSEIPEAYRWLRDQPGLHVVAQVPAAPCWMERADALPMYLSTVHWKRTLEGYTSYFPPTYNFMKWRLFNVPAPESLAFLARFGVDALVVEPEHGEPPAWVRPDPRWQIHGPFQEGHVVLSLNEARGLRYERPPADTRFLREVPRAGWRVQASSADAALAVDGNPETAWVSGLDQKKGDYFQIRLASPVAVARISMNVRCFFHQSEEFPTHLALLGRAEDGSWEDIPFDAEASYERFFARLLHEPRDATLDIDLEARPYRVLKLKITESDPFAMPWVLSEIRLYELP